MTRIPSTPANVDESAYCQAAHTAGGKAAGLSEQEAKDLPPAPAL